MDQATLVDPQLDDVPRLIDELKRDHFDVKAALWLYTSEADQWYLYLVTDAVDRQGLTEAYRAAYRTMRRLPDLRIDRFQVKLVAPADPVAKAVMDFLSRRPGPPPVQVRGTKLGEIYVENAYIYKL